MTVKNQATEKALRACLDAEGFSLSEPRVNGETGVDLIAKKGNEEFHIEIIGFKRSPPSRSKDFFEVFFRAISRLCRGATRIVIALPARFGQGLVQRAANYGVAWERLGLAFPELELWLVETGPPSYTRSTWGEWLTQNGQST